VNTKPETETSKREEENTIEFLQPIQTLHHKMEAPLGGSGSGPERDKSTAPPSASPISVVSAFWKGTIETSLQQRLADSSHSALSN